MLYTRPSPKIDILPSSVLIQTFYLVSLHRYRTNSTNGKDIKFKIHLRLFDVYELKAANLRLKSNTRWVVCITYENAECHAG